MVGQATITPPEKAEVCTSEWIQITRRAPRGDTLINVGGGVVQVDLRRPVAINMKADVSRCRDKDWEILLREAKKQGKKLDPEIVRERCGRMVVQGCLDRAYPVKEIILKYVDPLGTATTAR